MTLEDLSPDSEEWECFIYWLDNIATEETDTIGQLYTRFREEK